METSSSHYSYQKCSQGHQLTDVYNRIVTLSQPTSGALSGQMSKPEDWHLSTS